jgi:hypothetical protein
MKYLVISMVITGLFYVTKLNAQVPVREEPRHHPVLQNKYIRLLDVWIPPGDTSLFHIHATPSLFIELSNGVIGSQIKGAAWINDKAIAGKTWYRSFINDTLVHRVCNPDSEPLHVNDIEILSSYNSDNLHQLKPLPFPLLYENEKAYAYQFNDSSFNKKVIKNRGPMIAELISGGGVNFYDVDSKKSISLSAVKYLYIEPGKSFYFSKGVPGEIKMVLFEIK